MAILNILSGSMWAVSGGQHEISLTLARPGGRGTAYVEASLARVRGSGAAYAWISAYRYQPSPDQILVGLDPNPDGARSVAWINNCLSATLTLRVHNEYAFAVAKLLPWA